MQKNRKGFTLVELLAVIVILAIILAIAVPSISNIISTTRNGAFESDAKMIVTGIEYQNLQYSLGIGSQPTASATELDSAAITGYGASPANYTNVYIIDMDPITICVDTPSNSQFGTHSAAATKSTIIDLSAANTGTDYEADDDCADVIARLWP